MLLGKVPVMQLLDNTSVCNKGSLNSESGSDPSRLIFASIRYDSTRDTLSLTSESRVPSNCILFDKSIPTSFGIESSVPGIDP